MSFSRRAVRIAGGLLVALAIFSVTGELLARVFHVVDRLNGFPRRLFVYTDDPEIPYRMRPGADVLVRGVRVRANSRGLRDREFTDVPASGVHRVLVVGDSSTFGEGLPADQAFPAQLERELARRGGGPWEVLNAGVEGYNTTAEVAWLRRDGLALAPQTVVVGFNLNDFDYTPVLGPQGVLTTDRSARTSSRSPANLSDFYLLLRWLVAGRVIPGREPGERFSAFDRYVSALRKQWWRNPNDERWSQLRGALLELGELARNAPLDLIVAVIPDGDQVAVDDPDLTPQRRLLELCAEAGIECLDLHPAFAAEGGGELFLDTMHPNARGYGIIARVLADRLRPAG